MVQVVEVLVVLMTAVVAVDHLVPEGSGGAPP